jgi:uncharacterized caspase-like protein
VIREVKNKTGKVQQPVLNGSPEDEFYFTPKKSGPTLFLLSIGISRYENHVMNLMYAGKDAQDVANVFKKQQGLFYDHVSSWLLMDAAATKYQIMNNIAAIKKQVKPGDVVMMFFSGHNVKGHIAGESYFLPVDGDVDQIETTGVDYQLIRSLLTGFPCQSLLFLDGSFAEQTTTELSQTENGVAVFTSTAPNGLSYEGPRWNNGLFAKALVEGINGAADQSITGFVDLRSLGKWLEERVTKLSEGRQRPVFLLPSGLANFKISKTIDRKVEDQNATIISSGIK